MLKLNRALDDFDEIGQPPSGGCVLKHVFFTYSMIALLMKQPPSGGCVLKHV